jgi:hypothetical protein
MRLPRVRFTVRGLMIAVAGVALLFYGNRFTARSARYRGLIRYARGKAEPYAWGVKNHSRLLSDLEKRLAACEREAVDAENLAEDYSKRAESSDGEARTDWLRMASNSREASRLAWLSARTWREQLRYQVANASKTIAMLNYYKIMEAKLRYEASHPWLSITPDPPNPQPSDHPPPVGEFWR